MGQSPISKMLRYLFLEMFGLGLTVPLLPFQKTGGGTKLASEYILEMRDISKKYGENAVLAGVSLKVKPGEIHALLGENGAGKSTLMSVLFGMYQPEKGEIRKNGQVVQIRDPNDANALGIGMVHQEFMLLPGFTITENIKLNREISRPSVISRVFGKNLETLDMKAMSADARRALDNVGMSIDEYTLVAGLPVGYMQFVEIAREIDKRGVKLLVFDEPTAVLTESEAAQLLKVMKDIAARGIAIIFITHRLDEVINAADGITILRDGKLVAECRTKDTDVTRLAEMMIGRKGESAFVTAEPRKVRPDAPVALKLSHLAVDMPGETVNDVSLEVREGEIFGIGGLAGQGKVGIPNGVMGIYPGTGEVELFGKPSPLNNARQALQNGMAIVSEDRRGVGLLLDESIENNVVFNAMQINGDFTKKFLGMHLRDGKAIRTYADAVIKELDIRCFSAQQHTGTLSGGNQQKVCIARALAMNPRLLFVSEPTRGIDIGAKKLVLETLVRLNREKGMTVVMVSSELMELRSICDRIAIVAEGKVVDVLETDASDADFGLAMSGIKPEHVKKKGGEAHD